MATLGGFDSRDAEALGAPSSVGGLGIGPDPGVFGSSSSGGSFSILQQILAGITRGNKAGTKEQGSQTIGAFPEDPATVEAREDAARFEQGQANLAAATAAATAGPIGVVEGKAKREALDNRSVFESISQGLPLTPELENELVSMFAGVIPSQPQLSSAFNIAEQIANGTFSFASLGNELNPISLATGDLFDEGTTTSGTAVASDEGAATGLSTSATTANPSPSPETGQNDGDGGFDPAPDEGDDAPPVVVVPPGSGGGEDENLPDDDVGDTVDPVDEAQANAEQIQADFDAEIPADVRAASAAADEIRRKRKRVNRQSTIATSPLGLLAPPQFLGRKRALGA